MRDIENLIERAATLSIDNTPRLDTAALSEDPASPSVARETRQRNVSTLPAETIAPTLPTGGATAARLKDVERAHVLTVLEPCGWKVKYRGNAAEKTGLKECTLRSRMKKLGIRRPSR